MVILQISIIILIVLGFGILVGALKVTQNKLDDIHDFLHDVYSYKTDPTTATTDEEKDMKQLNNVFAIVDDVLDGNINLEDIGKEDEE